MRCETTRSLFGEVAPPVIVDLLALQGEVAVRRELVFLHPGHLFGGAYGIPAPLVVAYVTATAEILLPILLVLGLGTRFIALGLLIMTGVIQLVSPEGWANFHLPWASMAIAIIAIGPGRLSIDHLLDRWCRAHSR